MGESLELNGVFSKEQLIHVLDAVHERLMAAAASAVARGVLIKEGV